MKAVKLGLVILGILFSLLTTALAESVRASKCSQCDLIDSMTEKFKELERENEDDEAEGASLVTDGLEKFQRFEKQGVKSPNRQAEFKSLLKFAREGALYDEESAIADRIAAILRKDPALRPTFEGFVKAKKTAPQEESCKIQNIEEAVAEVTCRTQNRHKGQDAAAGKRAKAPLKCVRAFNYDECVSK